MEDLIIESTKLQTSVEMLSKFFRVLSDGYNPVTLEIKIIMEQKYSDEMIFALNSEYTKYDKHMVLETKNSVHDITTHLRNCFQQSLDHLKALTIVPELFKSQFHLENLKTIIRDLVDQILLFIANCSLGWQAFSYKMGYEEELFLIHSNDQCMIMKFGNHIH